MGKEIIIFLVWLLLVCLWNFSVPGAAPIYDVIVAIILSLITKIRTN